MIRSLRKLHWALRLLLLVILTVITMYGVQQLLVVNSTSLEGVQGIQLTMLSGAGIVVFYAIVLFGGKAEQ